MAFENCCLNGETLKIKVSSTSGMKNLLFKQELQSLLEQNGLVVIGVSESKDFSETFRIGRAK